MSRLLMASRRSKSPSAARPSRMGTVSDSMATETEIIEHLADLGTATLHEAAGRIGALPGAIAPIARAMRLSGKALPVYAPEGDNLAIHRAIAMASPGDVLVVANGGTLFHGPFGDILALAAQKRGISGLVIDGAVRDSGSLIEMGFPVFARGISIRGTIKEDPGTVGVPVTIGGVIVHSGDVVVGDADGVVVLPSDNLGSLLEAARARITEENAIRARIKDDELTLDILGLPSDEP